MVRRKARPRALATPPDRFLLLAEARGQQIVREGRRLADQGPVDWRSDGSGRVWFAYARFVRPELCSGKVLASWNLAFKTPQPPALPDAARDAPAAQIAR